MLPNILENVVEHSEECQQIFREMYPNSLGNAAKYFGECPQIFREILPNILRNATKNYGESPQAFWGMSITQGKEDAGSVHGFMEFVVQISA